MKTTGSQVDIAEQIKWWDAADVLTGRWRKGDVAKGLARARECRHPDAVWLASLFPPAIAVSKHDAIEVLRSHENDPRALYFAARLSDEREDEAKVTRAAEMGYAPAQAYLAVHSGEEGFSWAQIAASQRDRVGLLLLGRRFRDGTNCEKDADKAKDLLRESAELGDETAQEEYARFAFGELDWERYLWLGRAAVKGVKPRQFCSDVFDLFDSFERGENGRILHTVGPVFRARIRASEGMVLGVRMMESGIVKVQRIIQLYEGLMSRARVAIACWSVVGRRCGVAKDVRVVISKMAWDEAWLWAKTREGKASGMTTVPPVVHSSIEDRIKWDDALEGLNGKWGECDVEVPLQMARECQHPDAQWLSSLFPVTEERITAERMTVVMLQQGNDPRAFFLAWKSGPDVGDEYLERAAHLGYAPAQAALSKVSYKPRVAFEWAQKAAFQSDRCGLTLLGNHLRLGNGCAKDEKKALELIRQAADMRYASAEFTLGMTVFEPHEWQRYYWWGRAAKCIGFRSVFVKNVVSLTRGFENGGFDRVLHTVGPVMLWIERASHASTAVVVAEDDAKRRRRVIELYQAMLARARQAIGCWSIVGLRLGVVKDIRVMIAKMAWEEAWRWTSNVASDSRK
jgi:TPR repeat protein